MVRGPKRLLLVAVVSLAALPAQARLADRPAVDATDFAADVPQTRKFADLVVQGQLAAGMTAPGFDRMAGVPTPDASSTTEVEVKTAGGGSGSDGQVSAVQPTPQPLKAIEPTARRIHTDYREAMREATESRKMLFI